MDKSTKNHRTPGPSMGNADKKFVYTSHNSGSLENDGVSLPINLINAPPHDALVISKTRTQAKIPPHLQI